MLPEGSWRSCPGLWGTHTRGARQCQSVASSGLHVWLRQLLGARVAPATKPPPPRPRKALLAKLSGAPTSWLPRFLDQQEAQPFPSRRPPQTHPCSRTGRPVQAGSCLMPTPEDVRLISPNLSREMLAAQDAEDPQERTGPKEARQVPLEGPCSPPATQQPCPLAPMGGQ